MEMLRGTDFLSYVRRQNCRPHRTTSAPTVPDRGVTPSSDTFRAEELPKTLRPLEPGEYDETRLRQALAQLAQGISALHDAGRVHRDIKPSNVFVTDSGRVVLSDLGVVTNVTKDDQLTHDNVVGTMAYMAPEQALAQDVGPAADWYSVGVMLYEVLTGRLPHEGGSSLEILMEKQQRPAAPPRQWVPSVPEDLDALCVDLLNRKPRERSSGSVILAQLGVAPRSSRLTERVSVSASGARAPTFVGRSEELAALRDGFEASRDRPTVFVVEGESGLGKTELVREFAARLTSELPDVVVLAGRCYERETVAYKALDGLVDELSRYMANLPKVDATALLPTQAGLLPRLFPVLQRVEAIAAAPWEDDIADPQEMRRQTFGALRELLVRLAKRSRVVLVIDDLQWTDIDSLTLLREILHHVAAPKLLLVVTVRPLNSDEQERISRYLTGLSRRDLLLTPFSTERAKELAQTLELSIADDVLDVIAEEAAGHPLFLLELARYVPGAGEASSGITLDQALWHRISELPDDLRELLEVLCVAGTPLTQEAAATAAELSLSDLSKAAAGLRIGHLVRSGGARKSDLIEPYHDRIREIVSEHLGEDARKHYHRRLAIALEQTGAAKTNPQSLVRHAEAAGDQQRAAEYAEAAADHAIAAMAFDRAAEFFQTALQLGAYSTSKTLGLQVALAEAFADAGRGPDAARAFLTAAEHADPATRIECRKQAAEQWLITGHLERGVEAISALLAEIGETMPASPRRALLSVLWSRFLLKLRGLGSKERDESQVSRETLTHLDVLKVAAHGLALVDTIKGASFNARQLRVALKVGEESRLGVAIAMEAVYQGSRGGPASSKRSRALLDRVRRLSARKPNDALLANWRVFADGLLTYWEGDFAAADTLLADAQRSFDAMAGTTWEVNNARVFHVVCLRHLGALARLGPLFDDYIRGAERRGDLFLSTSLRRCVGRLSYFAKDDPEGALRDLEQTRWNPPIGGFHLQHWYQLEARGEIALFQGSVGERFAELTESFDELSHSLLPRVVAVRIPAMWWRARLLLVVKDPNARKHAAQLARKLEAEQLGYTSVDAALIGAGLAVQEKDGESAASQLRAAIATADANHLLLHACCARRRLGELIGADEGDSLIAEADTTMANEGIVNPQRMAAVITPGFGERG